MKKEIEVRITVAEGTGFAAEELARVTIGRSEALDLVEDEQQLCDATESAVAAALNRAQEEIGARAVLETAKRRSAELA